MWQADINYLRVLRLAARTMETDVAEALRVALDGGVLPLFELIEAKVAPRDPSPPPLEIPDVDLSGYDELLVASGQEVVS